jgi:flavin-dependent dehydrogenase
MAAIRSDVVVIGAGPAGSAAAIFLARLGFGVVLLDRAEFPRDKPCGEYLTPGAVRLLRDEVGILPDLLSAGARPIEQVMVVPHNGIPFSGGTRALACPRITMDNILLQAAKEEGVRVIEKCAARRLLFDEGRVVGVADGMDSYYAAVTIGADGAHSLAARTLGLVRPIRRLQRIALVGHFAGTASQPDDGMAAAVTMYLPKDGSDACCGIGPACGKDDTCNMNIVVPVSEAPDIAGRLEAYFHERLQRSFPEVRERAAQMHPLGPLRSIGCYGHYTTRATHDGLALVGDAATFIHPFTGEGVYFALRGAELAAKAIGLAFRHGDFSRRRLCLYDATRRQDLLPRYRLCDLVQRVVHSPAALAWVSSRLRRSVELTDILLHVGGDCGNPRDLYSLAMLRIALAS